MSNICKFCYVCVKQCTDDCSDYEVESYLNEAIDIKYKTIDNNLALKK